MATYIVVASIALVGIVIGYTLISQYIEKNRARRLRIHMALKTKYRNLTHMISGFPPHFLPPALMCVAYRSLSDICDNLLKIEPKNTEYEEERTIAATQISELSKNPPAQRTRIDNPQQIKEVRQHLQDLQNFIAQQEAIRLISKAKSNVYQNQIKRITFQMFIDELIYHAKQEQQNGKARLAIHYFSLAKAQLQEENSNHGYDKQIAQLDAVIEKLEEQASQEVDVENEEGVDSEATAAEPKNQLAHSKEWDEFNKVDTSWHKKQNYD